ncbi:hypothetical protein SARC_10512 [Sphaeroforma arctica JP610]|uniref:Uncharacterized protein n=1 Tax=Sphaeroforma arctica JP610 TaxID=667725 RepID=A0A0L0FJQ7_9EUKA|nr:hypothetical protein SARC_10512 [Sphaeroforma arctica JP610]KNC77014.1 hypothetical protein SARC_10512 [Sphaeroforma arctica JP610]|eukprot:XP_014150916.1 hypothetical protein SARC_10512 [Sphaeroforma arctica JP610]
MKDITHETMQKSTCSATEGTTRSIAQTQSLQMSKGANISPCTTCSGDLVNAEQSMGSDKIIGSDATGNRGKVVRGGRLVAKRSRLRHVMSNIMDENQVD